MKLSAHFNSVLRKFGYQLIRSSSLDRLLANEEAASANEVLSANEAVTEHEAVIKNEPIPAVEAADSLRALKEIMTKLISHEIDISPALLVVFKDLTISGQIAASSSSVRWLHRHADDATLYELRTGVIDHALQNLAVGGDILEFGVFQGAVTRYIFPRAANRQYHAFDSFRGVPKAMSLTVARHSFSLDGLVPDLPGGVIVHDGWFSDTLPVYRRNYMAPVALAYIDCDLYESVETVLAKIQDRLVPGSILIFDDWYNFPNWERHSYRALKEAESRTKWQFVPMAFSTREHAGAFVCQSKPSPGSSSTSTRPVAT
jgi:hypothetical protein